MIADIAVIALLTIAVTAVAISAIGIVVMSDVFDRLHYIGPASMIAPVAIAAAVVVREGLSPAGIKALLVAIAISGTAPVLTHATARAARVRALGRWTVRAEEIERS